jgi:hypothetical protein
MPIDYPPVFINNYLAEKITEGLPEYFNVDPQEESEYPLRFFPTQPTSIDTLTEEFPEASENVFAVYDRMFRMRRGPFPHCRTEQLLYYFYKTSGGIDALIETTQGVASLLDDGDESAEDVNVWIKEKTISSPGDSVTRTTVAFTDKKLEDSVVTLTTEKSHGLNAGDVIIVKETNTITGAPTSFAGEFTVLSTPTTKKLTYSKSGINVSERSAQGGATVGLAHPTVRFGSGAGAKDFFLPKFQEFKIYQLEEARDIIDFGTARTYAGNKIIIEYVWHKSAPIKR